MRGETVRRQTIRLQTDSVPWNGSFIYGGVFSAEEISRLCGDSA